jgi:transcriptional regulator with XRE-family HTH domain
VKLEVGLKLKVQRIVLGIEARSIAEHLGISKTYISLMENGKRRISDDLLHKWSEYLGIKK